MKKELGSKKTGGIGRKNMLLNYKPMEGWKWQENGKVGREMAKWRLEAIGIHKHEGEQENKTNWDEWVKQITSAERIRTTITEQIKW